MTPTPAPRDARIHAVLLAVALTLGALALLVDSPAHSEEDFNHRIDAISLADWLRARKPGLRVFDLRSAEAYREFHLPQAVQSGVAVFLASLDRADTTSVIVLYGWGDGLAASAADSARAAGYDRVYYLADGVTEWLAEVMAPRIDTGGPPERQAEAKERASLSRYFGGSPRLFGPGKSDGGVARLAPPRGGCGF